MNDIVARLREMATQPWGGDTEELREAADEIERLRGSLQEVKQLAEEVLDEVKEIEYGR